MPSMPISASSQVCSAMSVAHEPTGPIMTVHVPSRGYRSSSTWWSMTRVVFSSNEMCFAGGTLWSTRTTSRSLPDASSASGSRSSANTMESTSTPMSSSSHAASPRSGKSARGTATYGTAKRSSHCDSFSLFHPFGAPVTGSGGSRSIHS